MAHAATLSAVLCVGISGWWLNFCAVCCWGEPEQSPLRQWSLGTSDYSWEFMWRTRKYLNDTSYHSQEFTRRTHNAPLPPSSAWIVRSTLRENFHNKHRRLPSSLLTFQIWLVQSTFNNKYDLLTLQISLVQSTITWLLIGIIYWHSKYSVKLVGWTLYEVRFTDSTLTEKFTPDVHLQG